VNKEPVRQSSQGLFSVIFPTVVVPKTVMYVKVSVTQRIREHDTAVIRLRSRRLNWLQHFSPGTPVVIRYQAKYDSRTVGEFVGYVSHMRSVMDSSLLYERELVCVSASYVFREADQVTYRNKTPADVVAEIARKFNFRPVVKQDNLRRDTVTQSGQTYWEFMHKLADKTGYVLKADGTNLLFLPLTDYAGAYLDSAPELVDFTGKSSSPNVIDVDALTGDTSLDENRTLDEAVFASVNPVTDAVSFQVARPSGVGNVSKSKYRRFLSSKTVSYSPYEAQLLAKGASDNGLMALNNCMKVGGNPRLSPYLPVQMNLSDASLTGIWVVKESVHTLSRGKENLYTTDVTVSTSAVEGIPRRRFTKRSASLVSLQRRILSPQSGSSLITSTNGFVVGSSSSSNSTWVSR
jgi:phage protein D